MNQIGIPDLIKYKLKYRLFSFKISYDENEKKNIDGVKDNGELTGLKVTDELLRNLGGIRSDGNIQLPAISVQKFSLAGGDVAVVKVLPSDLPPVRYKGRVWIRVGPRRANASESDERVLSERRASLIKTFDVRPCLGCSLDDLALDLFSLTYRSNAIDEYAGSKNCRRV